MGFKKPLLSRLIYHLSCRVGFIGKLAHYRFFVTGTMEVDAFSGAIWH
jgi:hypothetical protein